MLFYSIKFFFTFFRTNPTESSSSVEPSEDQSTVKIDLKSKSRKGKEIADIMDELAVADGGKDDEEGDEEEEDLLALMDKAK